MNKKYKILDYEYMGSTIGNAYFSGVTFSELWDCISLSDNKEQLDAAISATINLKEISKG